MHERRRGIKDTTEGQNKVRAKKQPLQMHVPSPHTWKSGDGRQPILDVQLVNPSRQRLSHQSSSTWAISLMACSSQCDRVVDRSFMSFLLWVTILWMFFCFFRHSGAPPPESSKFPRQNATADTQPNTRKRCWCHHFRFRHFRIRQGVFVCFRVLQGAGARPCTCH